MCALKKSPNIIINLGLVFFVFFLVYALVELFVSPHLEGLQRYYVVRDVDHYMRPLDKSIPTNSDSIRSLRESSEFKPGGENIIFLGDSFVFGAKLKYNQTIPFKLECILKKELPGKDIKVANFGWTSSSPFLDYRLLKNIGAKYHPKVILLGLDMGDFHDDIRYKLMLRREGVFKVCDKIPLILNFLKKTAPGFSSAIVAHSLNGQLPRGRFFITEKPLEETERYCDDLLNNLKAISNYSKELNARFILIIFPRSFQYSDRECPANWQKDESALLGPYCLEPFRYFDKVKETLDFPVYSLLKAFQETTVYPTCFDDDPHWNDAGTTIAAEEIAGIVTKEVNFKSLANP